MFCPLCKAEYRDGVITCTDCQVALVMTFEDAQRCQVRVLWEGSNKDFFAQLSSTLDQQAIPFTSEFRGGPDQLGSVILAFVLRFIFWRFGLFKNFAEKQKGWRVKVLSSSYSRAEKIASQLRHAIEAEAD